MMIFIAGIMLPIVGVILINFFLRTLVFTILQRYGAFDPTWDKYWPRLPWRPVWKCLVAIAEWKEQNFGGGAASGGPAGPFSQLALPFEPEHSLIGRARLWGGIPYYGLVGEKSERHKLYIAAPGSGKSLQLQTSLAMEPDDACILSTDPKGDLTRDVFYKMEERGHELRPIDPLGLLDRPSARINLLKQIDFLNAKLGQDLTTIIINRIAAIFIPDRPSEKVFFINKARELWARIMAYARHIDPDATLIDARRLFAEGFREEARGDPVLARTMLWQAMSECDAYGGYISTVGAQMLSDDDRTVANITATLDAYTAFLDHEQIIAVCSGNDIDLTDLKNPDSNVIIPLIAPVGEMRTTLKPLFGSIVSMALAVMEYIPGDLETKTHVVIEEGQVIGAAALPGLGDTAALMRGHGVQLTVVVQDMSGFSKAFPDDYRTIIGTADSVTFMACNDKMTYDFIANEAFGKKTVRRKKWHLPFLWTVKSWEQPVITPDQARRFLESRRGTAIVMRNGKRSMFVKIAKSYQTLPVWRLNPSRDHGETPARAWFREIWEAWRDWKAGRQAARAGALLTQPPLLLTDQREQDRLVGEARNRRRNQGS